MCGLVKSSGVHDGAFGQLAPVAVAGPEAPVINAPVVTAASSQYFQRTFNRLVVPPVVAPVAPPPLQPVFHVGPPPTVFVEPTRTVPVAVNPPPPTQAAPIQPNVAIAVATAHAAAPVATILLPPYPFGFPPNFGFIPSEQPTNVPDENTREPTTQSTTQTETEATTTTNQEPEPTTPIPSGSDNNFVQALPSNDNINFKLYGAPAPPNGPQFQPNQPRPQFQPQQPRPQIQPLQPLPQFPLQQATNQFPNQQSQPQYPPLQPQPQFPLQQPRPQYQPQARPQNQRPVYQAPQQPWPQQKARPQKLKTSVEVVPVPLAYITPPPLQKPHAHATHAHIKVVKHIYSFVPASSAKIILRPIKIRPARLVKVKKVHPQNLRANARDIEVTTFNPFPRPNTKPPKV